MAEQLVAGTITTYRAETAGVGSLATNDATARIFPMTGGGGFNLSKGTVPSSRIRGDLQATRPRMGLRSAAGSVGSTFAIGTFDPLMEAAFRATFVAAFTSAPFATTFNATTGVLTRDTGNFLTDNTKIGDVIALSAGIGVNQLKPAIVTGVTALALTLVADGWADVVAPVSGITYTRGRKLAMSNGGMPTLRTFNWEHWNPSIPLSERYVGSRLVNFAFGMPLEGPLTVEYGFAGIDKLPNQTSRHFTNATDLTSAPECVTADCVIAYRGQRALSLDSASLSWSLGGDPRFTLGRRTARDIYDGEVAIACELSFIRTDTSNLDAFEGETGPFSLSIMARELGTNGYGCISLPSFTLGSAPVPERVGKVGPQVERVTLLVGPQSGTGYDGAAATYITSSVAVP